MNHQKFIVILFVIGITFVKYCKTNNVFNVSVKALWNLNMMAECELGYSAFIYNNYGCWCGAGGSGKPIDGIDECCMMHDKCYDAAIYGKVCYDVPYEYLDDYSWNCNDHVANCKPDLTGCGKVLCKCDKMVVECWKKYEKPNKKPSCKKSL
ncbi:Phospholipase A2 [Strongyloides ratti]|uniref:Phospholipase A2 n=1 Tax=Strongyloides ratti TaxID=34506 RepID=A0A090MNU8_STRRB|nr:Phospholipase A2 [Strongyloides ratti]CEF59731.1 Phospholipase A2 [Strongyloides ratti]